MDGYLWNWFNFDDLDDEIFNMDETLDHMDGHLWNWFNFDDLDDEIFNMDETFGSHGWAFMKLVKIWMTQMMRISQWMKFICIDKAEIG